MLPTSVGIFSAASIGGGSYTFQLFFQDTTRAKFMRVGDTVKDSVNNEYQVTTWASYPSDMSSSTVVTVSFITTDTIPVNDSGFNSTAFTPGQADVRPAVRTDGNIFNITFLSGQSLTYEVSANWVLSAQASLAEVGDSVVDSTGKEYVITSLTANKFDDPFEVTEAVAEGVTPTAGAASLYRATTNYSLFQGTPITDPARTVVRNRDDFNIDSALQTIQNQISGNNASLTSNPENNTGSTIVKATPIRIDSLGDIATIDLSVEDESLAIVGVTSESISDGASGTIVTSGKVTDITTTATFDDIMYVSKTGTLTNIKPDIGVSGFAAGDFVISVGVISKNETNPSLKDLTVNIQIVGQL